MIVRAVDKPSIPSPWTMTELDSANLILVLRGAWLFDQELDEGRLRDGLERVLTFYPHLAGRMVRGRAIELSNAGVPFNVSSQRSISIQDVCASPELAHRFADKLHPLLAQRGHGPLLKIRLTRLRDGTLLNVCCSHACLDGNGFYTFVRNWGAACQGRSFPVPVLDQAAVPGEDPSPRGALVHKALAEGWSKLSPWTVLRMVMLALLGRLGGRIKVAHLSSSTLRRLRKQAAREASTQSVRTFDALSAHLARMCSRLIDLPQGTPCSVVTILDSRRRVQTLPADFAGNAAFAVTSAQFAAGASLGELTARIQRGLDPYLSFPSPRLAQALRLARALVRHRAWYMPYDAAAMHAASPSLTYVNNFSTLAVYDVDFGQQGAPVLPVRVVPHDLPDPVLIWPAPPDQDGVEVYFAGTYARALRRLPADHPWWSEMRRFESEP
ncbi:MAG: hypothetical protein HY898_30250 [Deltaproteobacteria bacterium]|nr:hypothetical protein [Deltaproteobacteria bacterium]